MESFDCQYKFPFFNCPPKQHHNVFQSASQFIKPVSLPHASIKVQKKDSNAIILIEWIDRNHFFILALQVDVMSSLERSRKTRSHSLKPLTPPSLLTQRSKRTLSLPNKAIVPPLINIQRYYDQDENFNDEKGDNYLDTRDEISCMGK